MPLGHIRVDDAAFPPEVVPCLRCGAPTPMRFVGPCPGCVAELREKYPGEAREVDGDEYVPKANVTPNAVALKDD